MKLLNHNQEAYDKIMEAFKTKNRVIIAHATGTGKSYIAAAVAENFNNVLVIAPNGYVLRQTKKLIKGLFVTYSWLTNKMPEGEIDLIILDEAHRAGAATWQIAVNRLLDKYPNAKVLGLTATPIRYLDNARDISNEIFEGNIISSMSLLDAINQGILPKFTLVNSLYSFNREEYPNLPDEEFERLKKHFENSCGVDKIIKKYIKKNTKKILVFSRYIKDINEIENLVKLWFGINNINIKIYKIHTGSKKSEKTLELFDKEEFSGIKILISINKLNEGIHIDNVDSVIMLRGTISPIIYLQQIGRCLSTCKKKTPIVLDLVNNTSNIRMCDEHIFTIGNKEPNGIHEKEIYENSIKVIDFCSDIEKELEKFNLIPLTYEQCYEEALKYKTLKDFRDNSAHAHNCAYYRGWLKDYNWLEKSKKPAGYWTRERCFEEAKKYKSKIEFSKGNVSAYNAARKHGWLDDYDWFNEKRKCSGYWSYERCYEEAKKCSSRKEFDIKSHGAYDTACKHKWLDDYYWFEESKTKKKWNEETCRKEALKYKTRTEFRNGSIGAYKVACKNNWIDTYTWFKEKQKHGYWNEETCREEAKKYKSRGEFNKCSSGAYGVAREHKWLDDYDWFEESKTKKKWDKSTCLEESKKYKTRGEFKKGSSGAYKASCKHGWLDEFFPEDKK